jgi:cytoskeletal protein RodZ
MEDVSIGGTLARARHRAGLTVAEVSARTRIREGLIRAIEQDELGSCGGDVYARGHIRAIAAVVGADSRALISEYDAAHPSGTPVTLEDLLRRPPPRTPRGPGRGLWLVPAMMLLCLGVIGFAAYQLTAGTGGSRRLAATASSSRAAGTPVESRGSRPSPRYPSASSPASPRPAPASSPASPRPAATAIPVTRLTPVSAAASGPGGTSGRHNPQGASLAIRRPGHAVTHRLVHDSAVRQPAGGHRPAARPGPDRDGRQREQPAAKHTLGRYRFRRHHIKKALNRPHDDYWRWRDLRASSSWDLITMAGTGWPVVSSGD